MKFQHFATALFAVFVLVVAIGLSEHTNAVQQYDKLPIAAETQPSPIPKAPTEPVVADGKAGAVSTTPGCACENCTCNPCQCGEGQAFTTVYETETYYERSCDGNTCRLIPRTRQVAKRVAVKAAKVASEAADVVREVVTPFQVSGGSTGSYVSQPVYYTSSVSYGCTGNAYQAGSFQRVGTVQAGAWTPRRVRGQPLRNVARRWGWWR